jgi:hypothetical protein
LTLKVRVAHLQAQGLGFGGARDDAAVVVTQDHDGPAVEPGLKYPLAGHEEVVGVD